MSYIFWKLLFQRLILAINQVFWSILRGVRILLTHCNHIVHKIWHHVLQQHLPWPESVGLGGRRFQGKIKNIAKNIHGDAFYGGNLVVYVNVVFDLSTSLNGQRGRRQEQELHQVDLFPDFVDGGKPKTGAEAFLAQCAMGKGQIFLCGFCSPLETWCLPK